MSRVVAQFSTAMCLVLALAWSVGAQSSPDYAPTLLKAAAPLPGANGVAFDARDDLWGGSAGGTITQIDKESGDILRIFGPGPRWGADDGRLVEIMAGGKVREVSPAGLISGGGGIAAMPAEDGTTIVYVPDIFGFHAVAGETGTEVPAESGQPYAAMTAGALGSDVVTGSWFMGTLHVWDPVAGEVVADLSGSLTGPALNAIGFGDHVIVSELGADGPAVVSVDPATGERALVASMGMPSGLATDGSDLCVADWIAGTVAQVIDDCAVIEPLVVATGLALPEGLAMIDAGSLAVAETGAGRISRVDIDTGTATPLIEGLDLGVPGPEHMPPIMTLAGVATDEAGSIYVATADGVVRYDPQASPRTTGGAVASGPSSIEPRHIRADDALGRPLRRGCSTTLGACRVFVNTSTHRSSQVPTASPTARASSAASAATG